MKLQNIPGGLRFLGTIRKHNKGHILIDEAKASGDAVKEREVTAKIVADWANYAAEKMNLDISITGLENVPEEDGFVVIANHQSYADILVILKAMEGHQMSFIAKDNLEKIPYVGYWIKEIHGIFIHRGDSRAALKTIKEGVETLKKGFNLTIFPEGTRSRSSEMAEFKPGSFKLATMAKCKIVPIALNGTYHFYEEDDIIKPAKITAEILPAIDTATLDRKAQKALDDEIFQMIKESVERQAANDPMKE